AERFMPAVTPEILRKLETKYASGINLKLKPVKPSQLGTVPNPPSVFDRHRMLAECTPRVRNFEPTYAETLPDTESRIVIVELGILRGVGLAVWCDLFPNARVIGLDVDLTHFDENRRNLVARGAFAKNRPEVYEFDELSPAAPRHLADLLGPDKIDVFIDDALHYDAAILKAMADVMPLMAEGGVYFVEDNTKVHQKIAAARPQLSVTPAGAMTVIRT